MNDLEQLVQDAQAAFALASAPADLENAKARFLGKSGSLTEQLKALAALAPDEKKARGALINAAKQQVEAALTLRRQALAEARCRGLMFLPTTASATGKRQAGHGTSGQ